MAIRPRALGVRRDARPCIRNSLESLFLKEGPVLRRCSGTLPGVRGCPLTRCHCRSERRTISGHGCQSGRLPRLVLPDRTNGYAMTAREAGAQPRRRGLSTTLRGDTWVSRPRRSVALRAGSAGNDASGGYSAPGQVQAPGGDDVPHHL